MKARERSIQIVCADPELAREYLNELESTGEPCRLLSTASPSNERERFLHTLPAVVLFDESAARSVETENSFESTVALLSEGAPVIVVAAPERQSHLTFLITSGAVDFVARSGNFVSVVGGLVERRLRQATDSMARETEPAGDFGEILRHEVNNPLTGILGNAEMLLAHRDRLSPAVVERLETIAELAVRLRETVRRLSDSWEVRHDQVGSA